MPLRRAASISACALAATASYSPSGAFTMVDMSLAFPTRAALYEGTENTA